MEMITKEEEAEKEKSGVRGWTEEDDNDIGNMVDLYYELQENSSGQGNLRGEQCHDLAKRLSQYLFSFSIFFSFISLINGHVR